MAEDLDFRAGGNKGGFFIDPVIQEPPRWPAPSDLKLQRAIESFIGKKVPNVNFIQLKIPEPNFASQVADLPAKLTKNVIINSNSGGIVP